MNEENSEKLLTTVDGADIVQSIKNFPVNVVSDHESGDKSGVFDENSTKVRRSTRDIKRPKFDDELVESINLGKSNIRKRHFPERGFHSPELSEESGKKKNYKAMNASVLASTSLNVIDSPKKIQELFNSQHNNSGTMNVEIKKEVEDSLLIERQKKDRFAANKAQRTKDSTRNSKTNELNNSSLQIESMKRWTVEDDIALVASVTHVCDLKTVYNFMKFSKKYSLVEIEERWFELLYDENVSSVAKRRMDQVGRDKLRLIQSKIPFSSAEEEIIRGVASMINSPVFEKILEQNRHIFHHARTSKVIEEHWRELKYFGLLVDQKAVACDDDLFEIERNFDLCTLVEGDGCLPLDIEERHATRNVVISERETQEWERVCTEINNGVESSPQMTQDTVAVIRGRNVTFDIRKEKALIGRSTRRHRVDVNLSLEGPSARISRKQALLKFYDDNSFLLNISKRPIYVDGKVILQNEKSRLNNNSIIEISLIRLHFIRNEKYIVKSKHI